MTCVVSLIPSGTEMICAMGGESMLDGRSHECDYPASILRLPVCTAPASNLGERACKSMRG